MPSEHIVLAGGLDNAVCVLYTRKTTMVRLCRVRLWRTVNQISSRGLNSGFFWFWINTTKLTNQTSLPNVTIWSLFRQYWNERVKIMAKSYGTRQVFLFKTVFENNFIKLKSIDINRSKLSYRIAVMWLEFQEKIIYQEWAISMRLYSFFNTCEPLIANHI